MPAISNGRTSYGEPIDSSSPERITTLSVSYNVKKTRPEKTMNDGQQKLPTQVFTKLSLKFFEQKRDGMF